MGDKGDNKKVVTSSSPDRSGVGTPSLTGTAGLTVGELLQRGARQLTSSQIKQLASGSTFEGMGANNRWRAQQAATDPYAAPQSTRMAVSLSSQANGGLTTLNGSA